MKKLLRRYFELLQGRDKGTSAVTFILAFPIFLTLVGVLIQYGLLANAKIQVQRAAAAAARSAMTALPTDPAVDFMDGPAMVRKSAYMSLAPLSPAATSVSADGAEVQKALTLLGIQVSPEFGKRYTFAEQGTTVTIEPITVNGSPANPDMVFAKTAGGRVRITVRYDFRMSVPLVGVVSGVKKQVGGVDGRYLTLSSSVDVQLSDGREVPTNGNGEP